jgi:RNA polymerase sigma-54 factor
VQKLDPPGIGARSVREGLLLQLAALPGDNELEARIIREHLEDLQKNRLPAIARALGVDLADVKAAIEVIGGLSLHPGAEVVAEHPPPIVPDVIVEYNERENRYDVRLSRSNLRELRIAPEFRALLERARHDKSTREFVRQKIEAASAIIDAVRYRRERLLDVARAVVEAQRDFLERGEQHLKVLRMSDLAARFNCDPSTVSRTVDEKYIQTPRGIYPLRRFFTGGAATDNGDALSWASIKAKVAEIVAGEDKAKPLSDDEIVERLKGGGTVIRRRTVAKYRAQLGIPAARQRRQY